jgi:hypothetical protein
VSILLFGLGLRPLLLFFFGLWLHFLFFLGLLLGSGAADGAYDLADVDGLALVFGDRFKDAVLLGLDLEVDLIRFELDERIARLYGLTLLLEPAPDRSVGDRLPKLGNVYLSSHCSLFLSFARGGGADLRLLHGLHFIEVLPDVLEGRPYDVGVLLLVELGRTLGGTWARGLSDVEYGKLAA